MTTAERIAAQFENDGSLFENEAGESLDTVCRAVMHPARSENQNGTIVYLFRDGSAIVEINGVWDIRADGCTAHCTSDA